MKSNNIRYFQADDKSAVVKFIENGVKKCVNVDRCQKIGYCVYDNDIKRVDWSILSKKYFLRRHHWKEIPAAEAILIIF